jgi:ribonuclease HIII
MDSIREIVSKIKAEKKVIFIDTCYSGGMSRRDSERITENMKEIVFDKFKSGNFIVMTASQAHQKSHECDKLKQGVFTHYLTKGLTGAVEHDKGEVDLHTLYYYIYSSVKKYVKDEYQSVQHPKFFGSFTGKFTLPLLRKLSEMKNHSPDISFQTINCIGIDESGKGDYFGPLVVAGVYVDSEKKISQLKKIGVQDSKKISDKKVEIIAKKIKEICDSEVIAISPLRYNQMWDSMGNLNDILAWSHAESLEVLLKRNLLCDVAISDQFASKDILLNRLKDKGKSIELLQRPKAEENIAVAAASILARDSFLRSLEKLGRIFKQSFSKGENPKVINEGLNFVKAGGKLSNVAKTHFKTTKKIEKLLEKNI